MCLHDVSRKGQSNPADAIPAIQCVDFNGPSVVTTVSKPKVLVIEDAPINQKVIQAQLRGDFDITLASTGKEALELCQKDSHFTAVLLDIGLPDISGFEVAKAIRALNNPLRYVAIIAHSAFLEDLIREDCKQAGINDLLTKPSSSGQMIATLKFWIGKRHF